MTRSMRQLGTILGAICLIGAAVGSSPVDAQTQRTVRLGNSWEFQFGGNPSTGYTWKLDAAASRGLGFIKLDTLGYVSSRKKRPGMVGAPAPFKFRITCLKSGGADLWFTYVGPTGKRSRRREVRIRCD